MRKSSTRLVPLRWALMLGGGDAAPMLPPPGTLPPEIGALADLSAVQAAADRLPRRLVERSARAFLLLADSAASARQTAVARRSRSLGRMAAQAGHPTAAAPRVAGAAGGGGADL